MSGFAQSKCDCEALIDFNFNGQVYIYDRPSGVIVDSISNDYTVEDFLVMKITGTKCDFFHAEINRKIADMSKTGWIKKNEYIGTYARNYTDGETMTLYSKPTKNSPGKSLVTNWIPDLYVVDDCKKNWLHVKMKHEDKKYIGWLEPDMQCPDPYSSCN